MYKRVQKLAIILAGEGGGVVYIRVYLYLGVFGYGAIVAYIPWHRLTLSVFLLL
jgi:hypothetical protein